MAEGCCVQVVQDAGMPLLLSDRAALVAPLPLVTIGEARMLGVTLAPRRWHRVRSGIYVDRADYEALPPWQRYAVRVHAFARKHPDAVLCLESAAVVHGLPQFGETRDIHVFDPERERSRRFGDVMVHTGRDPREVVRVQALLATGIRDTVVDLARVLPLAQALAVADSVCSEAQGGDLTVDMLRTRFEAQQNRRGRVASRWVWSRVDGRAESPSESVSRAVIEWSGFGRPQLQREFHYEGKRDRVDFFFPASGTVGEADGWQKYRLEDGARARQRLIEEKRREDRLRRHGHPFARWELADAWRVEPLVRALEAARVARVEPAQPQMLATLKRSPRALHPSPPGRKPS